MRFKLKEGTQRTSLRVMLSLNLIVPVDEMDEVEPVDRLTFGINNGVCAPLSKIHGFVKAELIDELWASRPAALTNMSLLPLLLSE